MNRKNLLIAAGLATLALLPMACSDDDSSGNEPQGGIPIELTRVTQTEGGAKSNRFAGNLLYTVASLPENAGKNICMSPISMQYLASIIANAADDETRAEIAAALDMENLDEINANAQALMEKLQQDDKYVKVALANSVWTERSLEVLPAFGQNISTYYKGTLNGVDFKGDPSSAKNTIDRWAADNTDGMVKNVSLDINNTTRVVLANATCFDGKWSTPFDKNDTRMEKFYCLDGTEQSVPTMKASLHKATLYEDKVVAELSYGRGYYSMVLVMPNDSRNIDRLFAETDWWELHNTLFPISAEIYLPKFRNECHWKDLLDIFPLLGMPSVPGNTMPNLFAKANPIALTKICQDIVIEVNESGTKAAVVTEAAGENTAPSPPGVVRIDHPFIYAIRENTTGTILFMGKVVKI